MMILHSIAVAAAWAALSAGCAMQHENEAAPREPARHQAGPPAAERSSRSDWRAAEKGILAHHVQLTFGDRFVKAGESYFSPDDSQVIFQAVEQPPAGEPASEFYAMFVADVVRDAKSGAITGLANYRRISPSGSANTCGWFHPTKPHTVIFASTIVPPVESAAPGFQHGDLGRYKWPFPPEMRIVECDLARADGTAATLKTIVGDGKGYCAEGSLTDDGRHLLYCSLQSGDADLYVKDLQTGRNARIVQAKGYDGGPFFSPDGLRICYRSDRLGDGMLQLFVADLAFNEAGEIVGIQREYQVTDESCVNWCPFWTGDGRRLVYSSSALGEANFEIYMIDADPGNLRGSNGTIKYGTGRRRITHFEDAGAAAASDVLPAFSHDGRWMIWTSRRGPDRDVQLWAARWVLDPDAPWKAVTGRVEAPRTQGDDMRIVVEDPQNGRIFVYDLTTHKLSEYDRRTHQLTELTNPADIERFKVLHESQHEH